MPRKCEGNLPPMRPTLGTSTSTTATSTPTARATTTRFGWCEAERGDQRSGGVTPAAPFFDLLSIVRAYDACRRGKQAKDEIQRYATHLLDHLLATRDALAGFSWKPSPSRVFVCTRPKLREIHAAPFADRVVHHLLVHEWERLYEPVFIDHSYANRRGKGTHRAVARLQQMMRCLMAKGRSNLGGAQRTAPVWSLHLDIRSFFHSIDRRILRDLLARRLRRALREHRLSRPAAIALWRHTMAVLDDETASSAIRLGSPRRFAAIPQHKRLGQGGAGIGLPVGNLTSQFFGNVVLNELDHFAKRTLKVRAYVRYVDDFVLLADSREQLMAWRTAIADFLQQRLGLALRDGGRLRPLGDGVDFLGYVVRPGYRLVRRRIVRRVWWVLADFERAHRLGDAAIQAWPPVAALDALCNLVASTLAHFRHAAAGRLWARLVARFVWLRRYFLRPERALQQGLVLRWRLPCPSAARSLGQQTAGFSRLNGARNWLTQVGKRWWWLDARGRLMRAELTRDDAVALCRQWRRADVPWGALKQAGWQRDGRRQRVLIALTNNELDDRE